MEHVLQLLVEEDLVSEELEVVQDQLQREQDQLTLVAVAAVVIEPVLLEQLVDQV